MPGYFFDLHNDVDALDPEGKDFPSLEAAKAYAMCEVRAMIQASVGERGHIDLRHHIDIRDEFGAILDVLHFEDAVSIERGPEVLSRPAKAAP